MTFDQEQWRILRGCALAFVVAAIVLGTGYAWLPANLLGLDRALTVGDRLAFALKCNLAVFLWLALCVRAVASGRFRFPEDRSGAAYGPPSKRLAVRAAVLQNSLEQTVLALGATLILATVLRGSELILIPLLVLLYLLGRASFALSYAKGAVARAFGMALTGVAVIAGYALAAALMIAGR